MKRFSLLLVCLVICLQCLNSQTRITNSFYDKYKRYEGVMNFSFPGWIFDLGASIAKPFAEDDEDKIALDMIKKIDKVNLLVMENANVVPKSDYNKFIRDLKKFDRFENLISVKDKNNNVNIMIREQNDRIKNVVIAVSERDNFILISLKTDLRLEQLNEILKEATRKMEIEDNPANILRV